MNRQDIARRNGPGDDFVAADFVIFQGLLNDLLEGFGLRLTRLRLLCAPESTACPIVMPSKFSQPTVSLCGSLKASFLTMRMGPRPALTSSRRAWLRKHVGTGCRST